jgi:4-amino-4-deoxy-L-arabinose transferase-like glycosyltransferase
MGNANTARLTPSTKTLWLTVLAVALMYVWGIDSIYMPSNGDEMVYVHIARLTAISGHWLPLVSDLNDMRNTKPPMLFWQSMWVSDWGQYWQLWLLRLPSLVYLMLVCTGMGMLLHRWLGEWQTPAWAVLCLLLFWGTFRYGRPYLTTAPEMFWFSLAPGFVLWTAAKDSPRAAINNTWQEWRGWTLLGLLTGIGLAYKSFALIAPVAIGVWLMRMAMQPRWSYRAAVVSAAQIAWMGLLAVGLFACWLLIDPQPQEVWREFVQKENAGKMNNQAGYWAQLFSWKGSSDYLTAPLQNTGLLFPWVLALLGLAWRQRRNVFTQWRGQLSFSLVVWIVVWCVVFLLPSQRSSRYLLPVMPALAMLMALHVKHVSLLVARFTGFLSLAMLSVLLWLAMHASAIGLLPPTLTILVVLCSLTVSMLWLCMWRVKASGVFSSLQCAALAMLGLNALLQGMTGERIAFQGDRPDRPQADTVWVNEGFNGEFERLQFLLPGNNKFKPDQHRIDALTTGSDNTPGTWFIVARLEGSEALPCEVMKSCERVAMRWDIEQRLKPGQVNLDNINRPREWLWRQEWLMRVR